ncbi:LOW QUALITY PROTEIN: immunoglobulin-like and fibronectin type III domain-containing protein 1 [Centroberyx affinis]|uniref:LOW QUALITY PROTEIN: immunoglobulin-like and fibronectin type III domain-containing protein 1 n=1 Tax=Centroberyx affinis TaxID=166261 RepID=UPI003A5C503E
MITQYVEQVPAGKSTPDFSRKPMPLTVQEGKKAFFKAMVTGEPAPTVTWGRNKGEVADKEKYKTRYDERAREHILEIPDIKPDQADTYKCFATNEYGKAVCTATLNVMEVGFKKKGQTGKGQVPQDFRSMLKKTVVVTRKKQLPPKKEGEIDPKLWELLLCAPKKDYEKICFDFGVTDFRWMLKRLSQMKKERKDEQAKVVENLENVKQIEVKPNGTAEFGLDMTLWDPNSTINLYKDGTMVPYGNDEKSKHSLKKTGTKYLFSINNPQPEDAGFYQVDVDEANVLTTDFQVPAVEFIAKIKDVKAVENEDAIFQCALSTPLNRITWSTQDTSVEHGDKYEITVSEDKLIHTLRVKDCAMADNGAYYAIAGIASSRASLKVEDRGVQFVSGLSDTVANIGERAELSCKLSSETSKGCWYKNGKLLTSEDGVTIIKDGACHKMIIDCCTNDDAAVYRFEAEGRKSEATLNIQDPPKIDLDALGKFSEPVIVKAGENAKWKLPFSGGEPMTIQWYKDDDELLSGLNVKIETSPSESQLRLSKCQRKDSGEVKIKIKNEFGTKEAISKLIVLGYPGAPAAPKVVSAFKDCINLTWSAPCDTGGTKIVGYNLEKHKKGTNYRSLVNQEGPIKDTKYAVKDVIEGAAYEFRVSAVNLSGAGEPSIPCDTVFARNPMKPPGKVIDLKLTSSNYNTFSLAWTKPTELKGVQDEAQGYYVEIRPIENLEWTRCNANPITLTSFTVLGLKAMATYWVRVIATNYGGDGEPQGFDNYIIAMPPPVRPKFKGRNMKNFVVVRSGNTVRLNINFEASPLPDISWLKDGVSVPKHVTITNSDIGSQLLIPTSEHSDTGIYTITVKNLVGLETFNVEIRVTDEPKPTGPVELEQNVPGTVTLSWTPSPDEKRDDRLHYMVAKRDSFKHTWRTVADNLFNTKCTVINILPGREYYFRVFAKNDMGLSTPTESPAWGTKKERAKFKLEMPETKAFDFQSPPSFIVPLKMRTAPQGYECYMSCAVKGDPAPRVTWYRNNISLNTNTNYYITNVCGVCSLLILKVGPKDSGEYKVAINNPLGTAECSMMLNVRVGGSTMGWFCTQQQHNLDQLSESYTAMQTRITTLQQVMGMRDAQMDTGLEVEERILALEEAQKQAQQAAEVALATSEKLKNTDLHSQIWALHADMDTRLAESQQVAVSVATLQAMFKNQSEEFEAVKEGVAAILSSSSALAASVAGLTGAVASANSRVDEQLTSMEALNVQLEEQDSELNELKVSLDLHKVVLYTNSQEVVAIK